MSTRFAAIVLALSFLAGCATVSRPIPPPQQADSAGLLLGLKVRLSGMANYRADTVYFARQCQPAEKNCDDKLLTSSFASDGRIYLLNALPGRYQAVAASFGSGMPGDNSLYFAYFPASLSQASSVQVQAGQLSYAGSYLLSAVVGVCPESAEPAQLAYAEQLEPGTPKCGFFKTLLHKIATGNFIIIAGSAYPVGTQTFHYRGTSFQQEQAAGDWSAITQQVQGDLAGSPWAGIRLQPRSNE